MSKRAEFLAGKRLDDVAFFLRRDGVRNAEALSGTAESVEDGFVLVLDGERGRSAFQAAANLDPMALARRAMGTDGDVDRDLTGGVCPNEGETGDDDHAAKVVFAFAEAQNEDVGGLYAEGDVMHAYAVCTCGTAYSDKWVIGT